MMIFDKREVERRFRRSMDSYEENAVVQKIIAGRLVTVTREYLGEKPDRVLELGCGTGILTGMIREVFPDARVQVNDLVPEMCVQTAERYGIPEVDCYPGDAECVDFPGKYDLILSASTFQWFMQPEATLRKLRDCLQPGGMFVFSTFGLRNLEEVRTLTGQGLAYETLETMKAMLSRSFEVLFAGEDCHVMEFSGPLEVLRHLKQTGVNVSADRDIWTKGKMQVFAEEYNRRFGIQGRVPLTYHPMYFVCKKNED